MPVTKIIRMRNQLAGVGREEGDHESVDMRQVEYRDFVHDDSA
jgi:hypothetical protein